MVVPSGWRDAYREQRDRTEKLKNEVDEHLKRAPHGWFIDSRIKEPNSFFEKIETGRYKDIGHLEDFFGAMIVVPLQSQIVDALAFINGFFNVAYRRPSENNVASHPASDFRFNDIRLYGTLRSDDSLPPSPLDSILFEIQVKTFFQHAWTSATHDLVYKHPRFSWPRSRVAAQVKAMVESAELSMDAINDLESSRVLPSEGSPESELNRILDVMLSEWGTDALPANLKRATETLAQLGKALGLTVEEIQELFQRGRSEVGGHPDGWSPYQCLIDYASRFEPAKLKRTLRKSSGQPTVIHVTEAVLSRLKVSEADCPRALLS